MSSVTYLTFSLEIQVKKPNISAVNWLAGHCDLSKQCLKDAMAKGAAWLQQGRCIERIRRGQKSLPLGAVLYFYYNSDVLQSIPPTPTWIAGNVDYSVWYKSSGMLSHGSKWGDHCSITRWVEQYHQPQRPCFLIHRLDRAASGLMLIAHNKKAAAALSRLFEQRRVSKRYHALVVGSYPNTPQIIKTPIEGRSARTLATTLGYDSSDNHTLVDVSIETGRKHQIRRHLAETGYPIVGDRLYGSGSHSIMGDLQLRAYQIGFECPITQCSQLFQLDGQQCLRLKNE